MRRSLRLAPRTRARTAVAGALTALALLACGAASAVTAPPTPGATVQGASPGPAAPDLAATADSGIPTVERTPKASPTLGDLVTATPRRPPESQNQDEIGAAATVLYWVRSLNYAYSTGDIQPFVDASAYVCGQCALIVDDVSTLRGEGLVQDGGALVVQKAVYSGYSAETGLWSVSLSVVRYPGVRTDPDGSSTDLDLQTALFEGQVQYQEPDADGNRRMVVYSMIPVDSSLLDPNAPSGPSPGQPDGESGQ